MAGYDRFSVRKRVKPVVVGSSRGQRVAAKQSERNTPTTGSAPVQSFPGGTTQHHPAVPGPQTGLQGIPGVQGTPMPPSPGVGMGMPQHAPGPDYMGEMDRFPRGPSALDGYKSDPALLTELITGFNPTANDERPGFFGGLAPNREQAEKRAMAEILQQLMLRRMGQR